MNESIQPVEVRCPTCDALFRDGQLIWSTGKPGKPEDLAGLVCNPYSKGRQCINPCLGNETGDTWAQRASVIDKVFKPQVVSAAFSE
jgi:hypothetical protein